MVRFYATNIESVQYWSPLDSYGNVTENLTNDEMQTLCGEKCFKKFCNQLDYCFPILKRIPKVNSKVRKTVASLGIIVTKIT